MQNTSSISVEAVGATFTLSPGWLFVAGLAVGAIGLVGVSLLVAGGTRARRRRAALAESRTSLQDLQAERDRLAVELERQRAARISTTRRTGAEDGRVARDDDPAVIDLDDERRPARVSDDYVTVPDSAGADVADERHDPVGSDRHGLFHRRH
jgi:hypothetical protein